MLRMKREIYLILFVILCISFINMPALGDEAPVIEPVIEFAKCYGGSEGDFALSGIETSNGNFMVAGTSDSSDGNVTGKNGIESDFWIVNLSSHGDIQWEKCLGGVKGDGASDIIETSDGGCIISGFTYSNDGDVSGNHGGADIWIVKLNNLGNIMWQKCLGGSSNEYPDHIIQTQDTGYIIVGSTQSNDGNVSGNHGAEDIWVVKIDAFGNIIWQKCLGGTSADSGFSDKDVSVIQTSDGEYVIAGSTYSNDGDVSGNHGNWDIWVLKLDQIGDIKWEKCFGGSSTDAAHDIIQTSDGGLIISGFTYSNDGDVSGNHGGYDFWVLKIDTMGNLIWQKCYGGSNNENCFGLEQTSDGSYILVGNTDSNDGDVSGNHGNWDIWVLKIDQDGNRIWQTCIGSTSEDYAYSIQQTHDGGFLISGESQSLNGEFGGHGYRDFFVVYLNGIKLNVPLYSMGNPNWKDDPLGKCRFTIGTHGCAITSTAMVFSYFGIDVTPKQMNQWLMETKGGYSGHCDINWKTAASYDSDILYFNWINKPDINLIKKELDDGNPVIAYVYYYEKDHFVVITGYNKNTFYINDPDGGIERLLTDPCYATKSGQKIRSIRIYYCVNDMENTN